MILITGATGKTGSEIVRRLSDLGIVSRVMTRDPKRLGDLRKLKVDVVKGDFDKPDTLDRALEGVTRVYLVSPASPEMVRLQKNMVDAAVRGNVEHIVKLSVLGLPKIEYRLAGDHRKVEEALEASGLKYTHLRPTFFQQNLIGSAGSIGAEGKIYYPAGDAKISMVDVRDIADVAVEALTTDKYINDALPITGPKAITFTDVASILSKTLGKKVEFIDVPGETAKQSMIGSGMTEWYADALVDLFDAFKRGVSDSVTSTVKRVTGHDPIPFEDFARDFKEPLLGRKAA